MANNRSAKPVTTTPQDVIKDPAGVNRLDASHLHSSLNPKSALPKTSTTHRDSIDQQVELFAILAAATLTVFPVRKRK
ncbi:hypothetical protein [Furfurilactobacillus curtus]|uniref:hypothetical protein n=1 Tax=Furfurilactobacillus curtus TaxID=1746200 RepID=UPI0038B3E6EF